jgi:hypothetical protein
LSLLGGWDKYDVLYGQLINWFLKVMCVSLACINCPYMKSPESAHGLLPDDMNGKVSDESSQAE